jgi:AcrR family transcriptional regulator
MTNDTIIRAAFKVWGRDLYRTTSLTQLAGELGVSKAALYRHFKDKDALLEAMYSSYFDDCAVFTKNGFDRAVNAPSVMEAYLILMRTTAEYYARNREAFIFSLMQVYNSRDRKNTVKEFSARGINFGLLAQKKARFYPPPMQLIMAALVFYVADFHKNNSVPSNEAIDLALADLEDRVSRGLKLDAGTIGALDYEALEKQAAGTVWEDNALLRAVAEAVAEAGPWDASMEMVARRSGLSKSGLYAHFKSRQDMLGQLFVTELTRMANLAKVQIESSEIPEVQLYLGIMSIVNYLRSRPEILVAIDWIKTRRLELGKEIPGQLFRIIGSIKMEAIQSQDLHMLVELAQWIIFMTVNTLLWWSSGKEGKKACMEPASDRTKNWAINNAGEVPNESFRILFRFIALGLEGLNL